WAGTGLYGQLWAMWLLPLAWGLTWRTVKDGRRYAAAALAVALTIACHFIAGYLALLTIGVWVIVLGAGAVLPRLARAAVVAGGALLIALWVLVPLIEGTTWTNNSEFFRHTVFDDSYGARQVLGWLVRGELFDGRHRFPVISLLFAGGLGVCIWKARRDVRARGLLGVFVLSLILFCGRHSLGPVLGWLPGSADVQFQRFEMGVDLAGILIAGVGVGAGVNALRRLWEQRIPARYAVFAGLAAVVLVVVVLAPAWTDRYDYARKSAGYIDAQQPYDSTPGQAVDNLLATVKSRKDGRVYAGLRSNWGQQYTVGLVPMYAWLADHDVDQVGFTFRTLNSLSTDIEATFDETNLAQYEMLGIRYLLLPDDRRPPVPAKLIASDGGSRLYRVATTGYFQVVDRSKAIAENRTDVEPASAAWRASDSALHNVYPGVAFTGGAAPAATFKGAAPPAGKPGAVVSSTADRAGGVFAATVAMRRPAVVLLKASYDPSWTATVDGRAVKPVMMAPSLVGVDVPRGRHVVRLRYAPYGAYPWLLAIGILTALALAILPRRAAFTRRLGLRR
ncbi:MAG TPA: 6-pyruvoyl-tetrahydropterin synthase-related protein, partial [Gemmatimonadales bacterium]